MKGSLKWRAVYAAGIMDISKNLPISDHDQTMLVTLITIVIE